MKKLSLALSASLLLGASASYAAPADDLAKFKDYFKTKFANLKVDDFKHGALALNPDAFSQWESVEEFPPYEPFMEKGKEMWDKPFANGKTYASCFNGKKVSELRGMFPHWEAAKSRVQTLESALNECREANGEKPLKYKRGPLAHLSSYISFEGRGNKIDVKIPDDPKAQAAYEAGKKFFYAKRGQLNLSCADCHVYSAGRKVRTDLLSPAIGQVTHFPVFRAKWANADVKKGDGFGTLHRRYGGCNKQVRAKPFKAQSTEYRNLELFHTYMSNGQELNGPAFRK